MIDYKTILKEKDWLYIGGCSCNGTKKEEYKKDKTLLLIYPTLKTFRIGKISGKLDELENHI